MYDDQKIVSIFLCLLMVISTFAACSAPEEPSNETYGDTDEVTSEAIEDEETREELGIPNVRYDGETLCFLTRKEGEWTTVEIYSDGISTESDNISNAVFERNMIIQDKYGIKITEIQKATWDHITAVQQELSASTGDCHVLNTTAAQSASLSAQGCLWDLNSTSIVNMDLSKPWWDTKMVEGMSVANRLYFVTGDLLTLDNDATFVMLFNKNIAKDVQLPNLYELVENDEWTMEKLLELEQRGVKDSNGNGAMDYGQDIAGLAYTDDAPYSLLYGGGVTLCQKDEDDQPVYNLNVDRAQDISDLGKRIFTPTISLNINKVNAGGANVAEIGKTVFGGGQALFLSEVMQSVTRLRSYDTDFGILPFPMFDEQQGEYHSMMHYVASMVSIPKSVDGDKLTMVSTMLEAMAYYSVDTLTKEYYEINLKTKGAQDAESAPMIDLILENRICDLTYYYRWGDDAVGKIASTMAPDSSTAIASQDKAISTSVGRAIASFIRQLERND